ncbi:short-chain fatty acyl-CoA regulator family protein [Paracoccus sediminicola]|uniref:short-chain fatty acyl-CoA regulator family protein n=1 Tax=Paracoccus sediminicola TaxID=3017783 RepID=UPI0022F09ED6|nr:short-chain fatty acyl-CoA regulator family protein [Paracoccus sediminicola]WBU57335.1 short-chain fatty acyl-CoA regulator family protein [Paracoccus sediminicola]
MSQASPPHRVSAGTRIRERRLSLGRAQVDVAKAAGISPAYLNLIEHDRRNLTDALRARLAVALDTTEAELEAGRAQALLGMLTIAAAGEAAAGLPVEIERTAEFAARLPGWAALLAALSQRDDAKTRRLADLSDRMTQNPYLLDTLHEVLSAVTSLRSTASILVQEPEMSAEWRDRFHANLDQDSQRLSVTSQALVAYLDSFEEDAGLMTPQEEFEAWVAEGDGQVPPASDAARELAETWQRSAAADRAALPDTVLADGSSDPLALAAAHGLPLDLVLRRIGTTEADAGLMICDGAGGVIFRRAARGMSQARPGDACAMLPIFEALGQPGTPVARRIETESGQHFHSLAIATRQHSGSLAAPVLSRAVMLLRPATEPGSAAVPVGPTCRICPRSACPARRVPSILHGETGAQPRLL